MQLTLKVRSSDRYFSQGTVLSHQTDFDAKEKLEEDIAAVFKSRFSHSTTLMIPAKEARTSTTIKEAGKIFPVLKSLPRDGQICSKNTKLRAVNGFTAHEEVFKGIDLEIGKTQASVAIILWSARRKRRRLVAEFSFRHKDKKEEYSARLAGLAKEFFLSVQRTDWCEPAISTKTQCVYRETMGS